MNETKRIPAISVSIDGMGMVATFANGKTINLDANTLSPDVCAYATMHGLKQKLVDAAAIARNPDNGRSATVEDKYQAVLTVYNRLLAGEWNATRGEGDGTGGAGLLFRALVRMYPNKTVEQLREFLAGKDKSAQAALRKNPRVAAIIEEIKAESAVGGDATDSDAMLDELE